MLSCTLISENAVRFRDLFKLNRFLAELNRSHRFFDAIRLFAEIHSIFDHYTLAAAITACANLRDIVAGSQLHAVTSKAGFNDCLYIANTLLAFYAKSGDIFSTNRVFREIRHPDAYSWTTLLSAMSKLCSIRDALQLFHEMPHKNVAAWNAMISGCVENGYAENALDMFMEHHRSSICIDNYSLASILSLCSPELVEFGKQVHSLSIRIGFLSRVTLLNAMITMYFNSGLDMDALALFSHAKAGLCDEITFNAVITGLINIERKEMALIAFKDMQQTYFNPTELTFVSVMSSCSSPELGHQLHAQVMKLGYKDITSVSNAAIAMYTALGDPISAHLVFYTLQERDITSWNTIITCYTQNDYYSSALLSFSHMRMVGFEPDEFSVGSLLVSAKSLNLVETIHTLISKNGLILHTQVSNALISALFRHHEVACACQVFRNMSSRNLISSNTVISGLFQNGFSLQGLDHFSYLLTSEIKPNAHTMTLVLTICASMSALRQGKVVHGIILHNSCISDTATGNSLITFYSKCGELTLALRVFNVMTVRNLISWNSLISSYANHGKASEAVHCFNLLEGEIMPPDTATFAAVLSACSRAGLVDDGMRIFASMVDEYGIKPLDDHVSCMISLLSKAGYLGEVDEVETVIGFDHGEEKSHLWHILLNACVSNGYTRLARICSRFLLKCDEDDPVVYVQLANSYATAERWEEAAKARNLMKVHGFMKHPGCSLVGL